MTTNLHFIPTGFRPADSSEAARLNEWAAENMARRFTIDSVYQLNGWVAVTDATYEAGAVTDDDEVLLADEDGRPLGIVVSHTWIDLVEDDEPAEWTAEDQAEADADRRYAEMKDEGWLR